MIPVPAAAARSTKSAAAKINDQRLFTNRNRSIKIRVEFDKKTTRGREEYSRNLYQRETPVSALQSCAGSVLTEVSYENHLGAVLNRTR